MRISADYKKLSDSPNREIKPKASGLTNQCSGTFIYFVLLLKVKKSMAMVKVVIGERVSNFIAIQVRILNFFGAP